MLKELVKKQLEDKQLEEESANKLEQALKLSQGLSLTREVEIELPMLMTSAVCRPIINSEELRLVTLRVSGEEFSHSLNKVIMEHTVFKSVKFKDLTDFEDNISPSDKMLLMFALLSSTFSKLPEKIITCPHCDHPDNHAPMPSEIFHPDSIVKVWSNGNIADYEKPFIISDDFKIIFGIPSETDRINLLKNKTNQQLKDSVTENDDVLTPIELITLYIKRVEIGEIILDDIFDISKFMNNLPLDYKSIILEDETINELIEYLPKFYLKIHCSNLKCQKDFKWFNINPELDFFRKALSVYQ